MSTTGARRLGNGCLGFVFRIEFDCYVQDLVGSVLVHLACLREDEPEPCTRAEVLDIARLWCRNHGAYESYGEHVYDEEYGDLENRARVIVTALFPEFERPVENGLAASRDTAPGDIGGRPLGSAGSNNTDSEG